MAGVLQIAFYTLLLPLVVGSRCRLAVIGAGAPRTGSSHQVQLARVALQQLGVGHFVVDGGYWNWPMHAFLNETESRIHEIADRVRVIY